MLGSWVFGTLLGTRDRVFWYCFLRNSSEYQMSSFVQFVRYWILGTLVLPVILYYWYLWLDARYVGQAAVTIIKKMLLDQFLISPPILITFYTLMSIMEGREDITKELR